MKMLNPAFIASKVRLATVLFTFVLSFGIWGHLNALPGKEYPVPANWGNPVQWAMAGEQVLLLDRLSDGSGTLRLLDPTDGRIEWTHAIPAGSLAGNAYILHQSGDAILVEGRSQRNSFETGDLYSFYWVNRVTAASTTISLPEIFAGSDLDASWYSFKATVFFGDTIVAVGNYQAASSPSQNLVFSWSRNSGVWEFHYQHSLPGMTSIPVLAYERASRPGSAAALVTVDQELPLNPPGGGRKYFTFRTFRLSGSLGWQLEATKILPLSEVDASVKAHLPLKHHEGVAVFPSYRAGGNLFAAHFVNGETGWGEPQTYEYTPRGALRPVEPGMMLVNVESATYMLTESPFGWDSTYLMTGDAFNASLYETRCSSERIVAKATTGNQLLVYDFTWQGPVTEPWFNDLPLVNGCQFVDWLGWVILGPTIGNQGTWAYLQGVGWVALYGRNADSFWTWDPFAGFCHYRPEAWDRPRDRRFVFMERTGRFVPVALQPDGSRHFYDASRDRWFSSHRVPEIGDTSFPWGQVIGDEFNQMTWDQDGTFSTTATEIIDGQPVDITTVGTMTFTVDPVFPSAATLEMVLLYVWFEQDGQHYQFTIKDLADLSGELLPETILVQMQLWGPESGEYTAGGSFTDGSPIPPESGTF